MAAELRLLYSEELIAATVQRLADQINRDYAGETLLLVVVLKGAFIFAGDLARRIRLPVTVDFVKLSSYNGTESNGTVVLAKDVDAPLAGRNVLVVEDIVDTGITLSFLLGKLRERGPASLKVCTLVDKRSRRRVAVEIDYPGIECQDGFLVGYGLDLDDRYRELPALYQLT